MRLNRSTTLSAAATIMIGLVMTGCSISTRYVDSAPAPGGVYYGTTPPPPPPPAYRPAPSYRPSQGYVSAPPPAAAQKPHTPTPPPPPQKPATPPPAATQKPSTPPPASTQKPSTPPGGSGQSSRPGVSQQQPSKSNNNSQGRRTISTEKSKTIKK